jgi:flavorubredoxin
MLVNEIKPSVYYVGSKDPEREFFDQLVPLPNGTSYNSYLIKGSEKTALIDTVYPPRECEIIEKLNALGINKLDYIIANHGEQDHTGSIPALLQLYPEAMVVTNAKCREIIMDLLPSVPENRFITVKDRETLSLGDKTLEFILAPWVHWPDTMFTFLQEDKILFSCDFFGSHLADDALYVEDEQRVLTAAKRYYAEIMMPFAKIFKKYFEKIDELAPEIIAASHGPIYQNPELIINAYKEWSSDNVKNEVVILHISMYGSTCKMVDAISERLLQKGVGLKIHNVMETDLGELAMDLVDAAGIVIATPMVLSGPHPNIVQYVYLLNALKPKLKYAAIIGSYSWGGLMIDVIKNMLGNLKIEILEPLMIKGHPKANDYEKLDNLAQQIVEKNASLFAGAV